LSRPPLIVLGLDVGDPVDLTRWAREGHLPALASLLDHGFHAGTGGPDLLLEHGTWLSLVSGVSKGRHGYHYFRQLVPGTYDLEQVTGRDLGVRPFWAGVPEARVLVVDVPDTPPVAGQAGVQLSNWDVHNARYPACSEPHALVEELRSSFGDPTCTEESPAATPDLDRALLSRILSQIARKGELLQRLLGLGAYDLVFVVFGESHLASHQFWRYRPGGTAEAPDGDALRTAIRDVHGAIDREMDRLLGGARVAANVFLLSSTGLEDQHVMTGLLESFCLELGYTARPRRRPGAFGLLRQAVPERWRVAASRALPRATRERLLADSFRTGYDWERTLAFPVPSLYVGFLRVNLRGREPRGIVAPGAEAEALLARLRDDLLQLVDPVTGEAAVASVDRSGDLFGPDRSPALPDLIVRWRPAPRLRESLRHPRAVLRQRPPEFRRGSDHTARGFVAGVGPDIAERGLLPDVPLLSLAPRFRSLLGAPAREPRA
jgi:predicted AlkP superfamily phosphohydrolase/phosphomutase